MVLSDPQRARADHELVVRAVQGHAVAQREVVERLTALPRLLDAINRRYGGALNAQDLEDLGQDVTIVVLNKLELFRGDGTLEAWLYRFAMLEYRNRVRFEARRRPSGIEPDTQAGADTAVDRASEAARVEAALADLADEEATIVRLKHYEELTFETISERLGIALSTVKGRYYRGITALRRRLTRTDAEVPP